MSDFFRDPDVPGGMDRNGQVPAHWDPASVRAAFGPSDGNSTPGLPRARIRPAEGWWNRLVGGGTPLKCRLLGHRRQRRPWLMWDTVYCKRRDCHWTED